MVYNNNNNNNNNNNLALQHNMEFEMVELE